MDWQKYSPYSAPVLRIGLALVILWFGASQVMDRASWIGYLPPFIFNLPMAPETFVLLNGISEIILGLLLIVGIFVRPVAALLALHLLGIVISLGYNEIAVRDFGLMIGMIAIMLHGHDDWSLDKRRK
jgi:uncharacterized membrane protein YphA (DoxX/SURF4 family)